MSDPHLTPESSFFGLKLAWLVAGFWGGVLSLSFVRDLSKMHSIAAVSAGVLTAGYGTPALVYYLPFLVPVSDFVAFIVGLTAMNIIPGILYVSRQFRQNPIGLVGQLLSKRQDDERMK